MARMPFRVAARPPGLGDLSAGEKQKCRNPQAALSAAPLSRSSTSRPRCSRPARPTKCWAWCASMVRRGDLTVLMITHKFREVMAFCRRGHGPAARPSRRRGTRQRPHARRHGRHDDRRAGADQVTRAQRDDSARHGSTSIGLSALDDAGQPALHEVSLTIKAGEIVGIAGVSGNGQRELVEVLAGQREANGGGDPHRRRALPRHARGDAPPPAVLSCRKSRSRTRASPA